jgi:hypothetical protein
MCFGDDGRSIREVSLNTFYERPTCSLAPGLSACHADPSTPLWITARVSLGPTRFDPPDLTVPVPSASVPTRGLGQGVCAPTDALVPLADRPCLGPVARTLPDPLVSSLTKTSDRPNA